MQQDVGEWKRLARAHLASERAGLLFVLLGLSRETLQTEIVADGLTVTEVLFLIAAEDGVRAHAMERTLRGEDGPLERAQPAEGDFSEALTTLLGSRAKLLSAFARMPDDDIFGPRVDGSVAAWIEECGEHDRVSTDRFAEWRAARIGTADGNPPRDLLIAAVRAARKELLTEIALVPEMERSSRKLGSRTLGASLFETNSEERRLKNRLQGVDPGPRIESEGDWARLWRSLHDDHQEMLKRLESVPEEEVNRRVGQRGEPMATIYALCREISARDRGLAAALRSAREVVPPPSIGR